MGGPFDVGISLAALTVAFAFGEGLGRLACLSFGCCYGRRIQDLRPGHRRLFSRFAIRFTGETKKIAYERNGQDIDVVPIQLVTAGINLGAGLLGLLLFLNSRFRLSFLSTALMIQGWRFASEFLRADDRGGGRWSAYQWMSLLASLYVVALGSLLPSSPPVRTDILAGVRGLWEPSLILGLEALWASLFLFTGKSRVTGSHLIFFVRSDGARGAGDPGA
jgi:hypothetical protein